MRRAAVLAAFLLTVLAIPSLALGDASHAAANAQTYQDATGEDPAAPDISTIAVSNDDGGAITFQVTIANRPSLTADMLVLLFLDTQAGAGDPDSLNADYAIQLEPSGGVLFKWNGTDFLSDTPQRTFSSAYANGVATFKVAASELGKPTSLGFVVIAASGIATAPNGDLDFSNVRRDIAPTGFGGAAALYSYDVRTTLVLAEQGFATSPSPARAGASFSVALAVARNDTQGLLRSGSVVCEARVGGTRLAVRGSRVRSGVATCAWSIPAGAKGKLVRGSITVVADGASLSRAFSARIR